MNLYFIKLMYRERSIKSNSHANEAEVSSFKDLFWMRKTLTKTNWVRYVWMSKYVCDPRNTFIMVDIKNKHKEFPQNRFKRITEPSKSKHITILKFKTPILSNVTYGLFFQHTIRHKSPIRTQSISLD